MRRLLIPAAIVFSALSLVGCSASGGASSTAIQGAKAPDFQGAADSAGDKAEAGGGQADVTAGRQVIKTGSVTITTRTPARSADDATRIVEDAGGRVDDRTENAPTDGDQGSAELTVRIPSEKLTATIDRLKTLGAVENIGISSDDVTTQSQDLDARIGALRTSVDRLLALMAKATSTQDLITIESALSDRQANLESLESQKRQLDDQVDLATITLNLRSEEAARGHVPDTFLGGLGAGWNALVVFFAGVLVVLGVALPWLVLAGIIAAAVFAIVRVRRGRVLARSEAGPTS